MSEMQDNQVQEPVLEADGERLRTHAVSVCIWRLTHTNTPQSEDNVEALYLYRESSEYQTFSPF